MLNSVHCKSQMENAKNLVPRGLKPHTIKESDKLGLAGPHLRFPMNFPYEI
jgi:hypothetical protein